MLTISKHDPFSKNIVSHLLRPIFGLQVWKMQYIKMQLTTYIEQIVAGFIIK